jgi:hypothetical protein
MRAWNLAVILGLTTATAVQAQAAPLRFHFQEGRVLTYQVEHQTAVAEVVGGMKVATASHLKLTKRWQVLGVDRQGVATLRLTLAAMRTEQTRPDGEKLVYDSADLEHSTPALKDYMGKFLNEPLAILKVDASGKVVEVVKSVANRFDSELPFIVFLPAAAVQPGQSWERPFRVVLDPPEGTGEKYDAVQKYSCKAVDDNTAAFSLTTAFKAMPESLMDQIPLLRKQPQGDIVFDVRDGRLQSARLVIDRELRNHQGKGSTYHFQSVYTEQYASQ